MMSKIYIFNNIIENIWKYTSIGHQNVLDPVSGLGEAPRAPPFKEYCQRIYNKTTELSS